MTDIPKLTEMQAAEIRQILPLLSGAAPAAMTPWGLMNSEELQQALAAYDAEQRRQIRAEVIAECLDWVRAHASCEGIAEKIARDIEESVKP